MQKLKKKIIKNTLFIFYRRYWEEDGVQQHVMRKEILPKGTLYTTAAAQEEINFPDLLGSPPLNSSQDISTQQKHDQNDRLR